MTSNMNRPIKFRFWDADNKEMSEECRLGDDLRWLHSDMHIAMQFTGLTDKNGKEIYEGDVVKTNDFDFYSIVWKDFYWAFKWKYGKQPEHRPFKHEWQDCVVIGNIYENPELLEKGEITR